MLLHAVKPSVLVGGGSSLNFAEARRIASNIAKLADLTRQGMMPFNNQLTGLHYANHTETKGQTWPWLARLFPAHGQVHVVKRISGPGRQGTG
jgi:hypothetical protein